MWPRRNLLIVSAIIALIIGAHACGGPDSGTEQDTSSTPPPSPTPTPSPTPINPQVLLEQSGKVMEALDSFHFVLEHKSGGTPLLPGLLVTDAEGDVVKPDKLAADFGGSFGSVYVKSSLVALGEASYMTNPLTGRWENVPTEVSPLGFFNPQRGISAIMSQVDHMRLLSSNRQTYRLEGDLPAEALASLVGTTVKGVSISVELTIDRDDFYLLEAILDGRVTAGEPDGTVRVITLSRFNESFAIEPPL